MIQQWLKPEDLEREFGIKRSTQAGMRSRKQIPYSKIGNFIYYNRAEIDKWLLSHQIDPIPAQAAG